MLILIEIHNRKLREKMFFKWIKDLFLSEPEYIKNSRKPKRKPTMDHKIEHVYPRSAKGEFRFPVVPDDGRRGGTTREKVKVTGSSKQSSLTRVNPFKNEPSPKKAKNQTLPNERTIEIEKSPFAAREIPSPTHGFLPREPLTINNFKVSGDLSDGQRVDELETESEVTFEDELTPETDVETESAFNYKVSVEVEEDLVEDIETQVISKDSDELFKDESVRSVESEFASNGDSVKVVVEVADEQIYEVLEDDVENTEEVDEIVEEVVGDSGFQQYEVLQPSSIKVSDHGGNSQVYTRTPVVGRAPEYIHPSLSMLKSPVFKEEEDETWIHEQKERLERSLKDFHVDATVVNMQQGPSITRFEVQPAPGVKVNKITNLSDDLKLSLAAKDIRIQAPIPGKNSVGIEIPNRESRPVMIREVLESPEFKSSTSPLTVALGMDISGTPIVTDLKKMPHGLIAGATGSGKSVCINTMLVSLLYKASPEEVKLLLVDPKMVELTPYNDLPHLVSPVITDAKAATKALKWAVNEMESRYQKFVRERVRDIEKYNEKSQERMPYIVIVIDELADLMMVAPSDVEDAICRIAQKARACGIHLLVATQRPSVDVITGLIKANIPTRIAFAVSSQTDSRTILDEGGAEKLLGKGDMLFSGNGAKSVRLQGNFVTDDEIEQVTEFVKAQQEPEFLFEEGEIMADPDSAVESEDDLFLDAVEFVIEQGTASSSGLQRKFRVGYNRAARLIDMMEEKGFVSAQNGSKPREVLISMEQFYEMI